MFYFFVDWIKEISREGFLQDVVTLRDDKYECCVNNTQGDHRSYCRNFSQIKNPEQEHSIPR